jgi:hypothetical protein
MYGYVVTMLLDLSRTFPSYPELFIGEIIGAYVTHRDTDNALLSKVGQLFMFRCASAGLICDLRSLRLYTYN